MKLSDLKPGESGVIVKVLGTGHFRQRIIEMGFIRGTRVEVVMNAPLRDPIKYQLLDFEVSLRRNEAELIEIISEEEAKNIQQTDTTYGVIEDPVEAIKKIAERKHKIINVALVGNPNAGKTSLFNLISGEHEHVGNYSGITVGAKEGRFNFHDYEFRLVDLPGTYSISAYSPEELFVRQHIMENAPDVILNVVSASNLTRNLYLTTQLIDMDVPMIMALNMYDELQKSGAKFDYSSLGTMLGVPIVPTVSSRGLEKSGIKELFDQIIQIYEGKHPVTHHIHINHRGDLQLAIDHINDLIKKADNFQSYISARFFAVKVLEGDSEAIKFVQGLSTAQEIFAYKEEVAPHIEKELNTDLSAGIVDAKYGFVNGALAETYTPGTKETFKGTKLLDKIVTHKYWGFPIFILFMWVMFECTYVVGAYPQDWIGMGVDWLNNWVQTVMSPGPLRDLITDGVISGVGGVLVFLPNILILFFFISFLEDWGYLSRAAFIMDKIMHKMGLHGKSFVPMLMGFGCNVPAIMAARTLESRTTRFITILITPFMSCSARIPVYLMLIGAFFPGQYASWIMLGLYAFGILIAMLSARLFRKFLFTDPDVPFVMELPPYRMPTLRTTLHHMWEKSVQYLKKMGTLILFASIVIWALSYFPRPKDETVTASVQMENSYIGKMGRFIEPVIRPMGFNWKMGVGIVAGMPAKELVVSTLNVLYANNNSEEDTGTLVEMMKKDVNEVGEPVYNYATVLAYMVFILLCFPCIATIISIKNEMGSWKWALFSVVYTTSVAWIMSFLVYHLVKLFM